MYSMRYGRRHMIDKIDGTYKLQTIAKHCERMRSDKNEKIMKLKIDGVAVQCTVPARWPRNTRQTAMHATPTFKLPTDACRTHLPPNCTEHQRSMPFDSRCGLPSGRSSKYLLPHRRFELPLLETSKTAIAHVQILRHTATNKYRRVRSE